jgi:hypothetical protein
MAALSRDKLIQELSEGLNAAVGAAYSPTYSLVVVTLKDESTHQIMMKIHPHDLHHICEDITKQKAFTLCNEDSGIILMTSEIKHVTVMKVTKEN